MRLALATCSEDLSWYTDDEPLHAALRQLGFELTHPAWDDPGIDWAEFDACLIRTTWDYMERLDAYVEWAHRAAAACRLFNPPGVVAWNTDKRYLGDLERHGIRVVPTVRLAAGSRLSVAELTAGRGWESAVLKPSIGATARETLRFTIDRSGLERAESHLARLLPAEDMLLQPYLKSVETLGELSVVFIDGQVSHAVRKLPVSGDYRVQEDFGATDEPVELDSTTLELAARIMRLVEPPTDLWPGGRGGGPLLYGRVDFLHDADGEPLVSELELVEPSLFFRHAPDAGQQVAEALARRLDYARAETCA